MRVFGDDDQAFTLGDEVDGVALRVLLDDHGIRLAQLGLHSLNDRSNQLFFFLVDVLLRVVATVGHIVEHVSGSRLDGTLELQILLNSPCEDLN